MPFKGKITSASLTSIKTQALCLRAVGNQIDAAFMEHIASILESGLTITIKRVSSYT